MKKTLLSLALLAATLFHAAGRAEAPKPAPVSTLTPEQAALIQRYDRNHDGRLDADELAAAHESMLNEKQGGGAGGAFRAALVRRFDRNGDGRLDKTERAAARQALLARFDTNHDGRLDEDERAAMRAAFRARIKELKAKN